MGGRGTVWNPLVPRKVNLFLWRVRIGRIPTQVELDKRGVDLDTLLCPRCGDSIEDIDHALLKCREVAKLCSRVRNWWNKDSQGVDSLNHFIHEDSNLINSSKGKNWWVGVKRIFLYLIWKHK